MLREVWEVVVSWLRDERESWRRWLAWRRDDRVQRRRLRELNAEYRREIKAAGARFEGYRDDDRTDAERTVRDKYRPQFEAIEQERALAETRFLRFEAVRFNVSLPQDRSESRSHGSVTYYAWYPEWVQGEAALTDTGLAELRTALATERRRRREPLVAYVGLMGALTGLIAVTTAYCKRERIVVAPTPISFTMPTTSTASTTTPTQSSSTTTTSTTTTMSATTTSATTTTATSTTRPHHHSRRTRRRRPAQRGVR